jgi:hypothetical protein
VFIATARHISPLWADKGQSVRYGRLGKGSVSVFRNLLAYRNLLFILLFLNSGCIFLTDDKKAGLPYLRELYLFGVVAITLLLFIVWKRIYQSKASLWIIFMGIVIPVMSASLANLNFGQPMFYGLLEERRSFMYLTFFPTLFLLFKTNPTQEQLERFFLYSGLACATAGFLYYLKIIPENTGLSFQVDQKFVGEDGDPLRPDRYRIGPGYVSLCAFLLMYSMKERISLVKVGMLLYLTAYLWLVLQTRQTMVIWAIAGIWVFRNRIDSLMKLGALVSVILVGSYFMVPEFYTDQYDKLMALIDEATDSGTGARDVTSTTAIKAVADNMYIGMGALSLQWNGGFSRIYNEQFYLSDVGIIGVYYRFGLLAILVALIYYGGYLQILKNCEYKGPLLSAFQLSFAFQIINMFLSNAIMYGGDIIGVAAAALLYFARPHEQNYPLNKHRGRSPNDTVQYSYN